MVVMANPGRPPKEDVERRPCPRKGHRHRRVALDGLVRSKDGTPTHQRFLCSPGTDKEHSFRVRIVKKPAEPPVRRLESRP